MTIPAENSALDEAEAAQALVGTWVWIDETSGEPVSNQLTLLADGTYTYTTSMAAEEFTASGVWYYQDGWLQFRPNSDSPADPAMQQMAGPIQVLEIGPDFVRTPAGLALHAA